MDEKLWDTIHESIDKLDYFGILLLQRILEYKRDELEHKRQFEKQLREELIRSIDDLSDHEVLVLRRALALSRENRKALLQARIGAEPVYNNFMESETKMPKNVRS